MKGKFFSESLFHATIDGRKTQFREVIPINYNPVEFEKMANGALLSVSPDILIKSVKSRYKVGETVYLKEPYCLFDEEYYLCLYRYLLKEEWLSDKDHSDIVADFDKLKKWKNPLFMPESAARHFIKITNVRAERLQDISDEDCLKEGIQSFTKDGSVYKYGLEGDVWATMPRTPREAYSVIFDKINGKGSWDKNSWVWVYDYEILK